MTQDQLIRRVLKPLVWVLSLGPVLALGWYAYADQLTANPIEFLIRYTGDWALRFLLLALAITPLRTITGWNGFARFRRLIGLFAFFYVILHLSSYIGLEQFFDWNAIWLDIVKRTYITVGMISFVILLALASTSTKGMIKRVGGKNWNRLHKGVYVAGVAACIHFYMMRKGVQLEPIIYFGICLLLLGYRLVGYLKKQQGKKAAASTA